jgi:hypothetical protein
MGAHMGASATAAPEHDLRKEINLIRSRVDFSDPKCKLSKLRKTAEALKAPQAKLADADNSDNSAEAYKNLILQSLAVVYRKNVAELQALAKHLEVEEDDFDEAVDDADRHDAFFELVVARTFSKKRLSPTIRLISRRERIKDMMNDDLTSSILSTGSCASSSVASSACPLWLRPGNPLAKSALSAGGSFSSDQGHSALPAAGSFGSDQGAGPHSSLPQQLRPQSDDSVRRNASASSSCSAYPSGAAAQCEPPKNKTLTDGTYRPKALFRNVKKDGKTTFFACIDDDDKSQIMMRIAPDEERFKLGLKNSDRVKYFASLPEDLKAEALNAYLGRLDVRLYHDKKISKRHVRILPLPNSGKTQLFADLPNNDKETILRHLGKFDEAGVATGSKGRTAQFAELESDEKYAGMMEWKRDFKQGGEPTNGSQCSDTSYGDTVSSATFNPRRYTMDSGQTVIRSPEQQSIRAPSLQTAELTKLPEAAVALSITRPEGTRAPDSVTNAPAPVVRDAGIAVVRQMDFSDSEERPPPQPGTLAVPGGCGEGVPNVNSPRDLLQRPGSLVPESSESAQRRASSPRQRARHKCKSCGKYNDADASKCIRCDKTVLKEGEHWYGHPGNPDCLVAIVSCFGAADSGHPAGHVYEVMRNNKKHAVSVMFDKNLAMPEFWMAYAELLKQYAEPKSYIVVICMSDGSIGNVQRQEVQYIAVCDGQIRGGSGGHEIERPDFTEACKMVLTFNEYVAWQSVDFGVREFGREFNNGVKIPRLQELEERFTELANGSARCTIR